MQEERWTSFARAGTTMSFDRRTLRQPYPVITHQITSIPPVTSHRRAQSTRSTKASKLWACRRFRASRIIVFIINTSSVTVSICSSSPGRDRPIVISGSSKHLPWEWWGIDTWTVCLFKELHTYRTSGCPIIFRGTRKPATPGTHFDP